MKSIRTFLILTVLATILLFNFVAAIQGYHSGMKKAEQLFDEQMLATAKLIAHLPNEQRPAEFSHGDLLTFQVWHESQLLLRSANAPLTPLLERQPAYGHLNFDGYRWRTLSYFDRNQSVWVMLAERNDLRFMLAEEVILATVQPLLIGIPLVGLFIWLIVYQGLRPLTQLAGELANKRAEDLSPVTPLHARKELHQVTESVNRLLTRLREALEREKRFASDAAHELRTPISALKIQLHNLQQELPMQADSLEELDKGVDRMHHLVEELLLMSRTSAEAFLKNEQQLDLFSLTQEWLAEHYEVFEAKAQNIELIGTRAEIQGHKVALQALLKNLLLNAQRYTPQGGQIRASLNCRGGYVHLLVEDSGPGIAPDQRQRIFDRFYRGAAPKEADTMGCGLGLAIVKQIADLHHAEIEVGESQDLKGSAFLIRFPQEQRHAQQ